MKYKFAAFDMDGTLLDTMWYWQTAARNLAIKRGVYEVDREVYETAEKLDYYACLDYLKSHVTAPEMQDVVEDDFADVLEEDYKKASPVRKGVIRMLDTLKANGVKMCVISATRSRQVKIALKNAGISDFFEFILSPDDFSDCKFGTAIFLEAAKRLGCDVTEMAMFEDALYSMKTAKKLGMYVVAVKERCEKINEKQIAEISDEFYNEFTEFKYE